MNPLEKILKKLFKDGWMTRDYSQNVDFNDSIQMGRIKTAMQEILALIPKDIEVKVITSTHEVLHDQDGAVKLGYVATKDECKVYNLALSHVRRAMGREE